MIFETQLSDADYYYYRFYINGGSPNTGSKYVINLDVNGKIDWNSYRIMGHLECQITVKL